jgi:hypothetical protein
MDIPAQVDINKETCVSLAATLGIALSALDTVVNTSEDTTTHYWREQQARGKLQIAEETKEWANEYIK